MSIWRQIIGGCTSAALFLMMNLNLASAQIYEPVVPGTGIKIAKVGDDFEDVAWKYQPANPKSSRDLDKRERLPTGKSENERWYEGVKRGHPDVVRRVATPLGGLTGSNGALLLQSLRTGLPNRTSDRQQQDDFIADVHYRLGGAIPVSQSPNVVVRVYLPGVDRWEQRQGTHFGFRIATVTTTDRVSLGFLSIPKKKSETYWPGMFLDFEPRQTPGGNAYASWRVRGDNNGNDYESKSVTSVGWWTLGMSLTPDGRVHYFAKPGIEKLAIEDRLASEFPYGYRAEHFKTFFFNICNGDDGHTLSTPFVIDDPAVYFVRPARTALRP